ncbi:uncharacterized protein [Rutidosis leptorrhynchoides]|uniref:uncharacterized protein n=1 Tax=Rutidosis leptorrhynchoides TaxID=125765 RepID=UPI003A9A2E99
MTLTSWNIRGLGNKSRGHTAGSLVIRYQSQCLAIQETMVKEVSLPVLNEIWKHYAFGSIQVEASGRSGDILSIWRTDVFSLIMSWKRKHWIETVMRYHPSNIIVLIVNIYALHLENKKTIVWSQLSNMALKWLGLVYFMGDFNVVCHPEERLRETVDPISISNFNDFISNASLFVQPLTNSDLT